VLVIYVSEKSYICAIATNNDTRAMVATSACTRVC
jgi:hypothetical protein